MSEKVSVIIPAYRAANTVGRAVESLLTQTRPPEEIVIVDDGSPDDIAAAVRKYGDRVRLVRQANGGASRARNLGIDVSSGDFVAFLDADDYWEPIKLERQFEVLDKSPGVGLIAGRWFPQPPDQPRQAPGPEALPWSDRVIEERGADAFEVAARITTSTVMVRRSVLGDQRFDVGLRTAEDLDLWIRLVLRAPVYLLSAPLVTLVLEPGSLSRSDASDDCGNMLQVVRRHANLLGAEGLRVWEARVFRLWASCHLGNREPAAALVPAWNRCRSEPWSVEGWWILLKSAAWTCNDWLLRRS